MVDPALARDLGRGLDADQDAVGGNRLRAIDGLAVVDVSRGCRVQLYRFAGIQPNADGAVVSDALDSAKVAGLHSQLFIRCGELDPLTDGKLAAFVALNSSFHGLGAEPRRVVGNLFAVRLLNGEEILRASTPVTIPDAPSLMPWGSIPFLKVMTSSRW